MTNGNTGQHDGGWLQAAAYLEEAWQWLCERREHAPAQACVWHLRHHWQRERPALLRQLLAGEYRLSPLQVVGRGSDRKAMWSARDALVLKWVALQVAPLLPLHGRCEHVRGHGGGPASVARLSAALTGQGYTCILRTDVKGYYANMDKTILLSQVRASVTQPVLLALITQYVHYTVEDGGTFHTPEKGISRSCALSPLMGALYLQEMDVHFAGEMARGRLYYARYMDDIVILAHTRWQLRKHVRRLNQFLAEKHVRQHPDKTFIGKTARGFDWMGAWLEPEGVTDIAPRAKAGHRERVRRLYERAWRRREPEAVTRRRVSAYRWRWTIWACALLGAQATAQAATLRIVVPAGVGGVVGRSSVVSASTGNVTPIDPYVNGGGTTNGPCITAFGVRPLGGGQVATNGCMTVADEGDGNLVVGPGGIAGITLSGGPTAGGVLALEGTINFRRTLTDGTPLSGIVSISPAGTSTTWAPAVALVPNGPAGHVGSGAGGGTSSCGMLWGADFGCVAPGEYRPWLNGASTFAGANVSFLVDAPAGGLLPGNYSTIDHSSGGLGDIYLVDPVGGQSAPGVLLVDAVEVLVATYSCTLDASANDVDLSPGGPTAGVQMSVRCTDGTPASTASASYSLDADAAGASQTGTDPRDLTVSPEAAGLTVRGAWSATPPSCSGGDVYFDGREGPTVLTMSPGQTNQTRTQPMAFRLCGTAAPGAYTAQMTVRLVGR